MSNGIELDGGRTWWAASWVARNAIGEIIKHLEGPFAGPIAERLRVVHHWSGADADFRGASQEEVAALASAARCALRDIVAQGDAGWNDPSFFPGYLARFRELVALLDDIAPERG